MYCKAGFFNDAVTAEKILAETEPIHCKILGRQIKNYDDSWNNVRESFMFDACYNKFLQNPNLKKQLLDTQNRLLVEASPFDNIWGIGLAEDNIDAENIAKWRGRNLLGKVLMDVRGKLVKEQ
jgi:hypothetical protein